MNRFKEVKEGMNKCPNEDRENRAESNTENNSRLESKILQRNGSTKETIN